MSPRIELPSSPLTEPFWEATKARRLLLQWCRACDAPIHYPREMCPKCLGSDLEWREASGRGEVYACSVMHRSGNPLMADRVPYVVALIELEEGARMLSNVVGTPPEEVEVGMPVKVAWEELSDGRALPLFEPRR